MDPQAVWNEIKALIQEGETEEPLFRMDSRYDLAERLQCLAEWIMKGGYWPKP